MLATRSQRLVLETALVFLAFALPMILASSRAAGIPPGISPLLPGLLLSSLPQVGIVLYLLGLQGELGRAEIGLKALGGRDAAMAALLTLILFAVLAGSQLMMTAMPPEWVRIVGHGERIKLAGWAELPVALVFAPVAAAREELIFRCYLYVRLRDLRVPVYAALALTNAAFAAAHAYQGPLAVILALIQGLALGVAFVRTRRIWVPTIAHAVYNFTLLALTLIPDSGSVR